MVELNTQSEGEDGLILNQTPSIKLIKNTKGYNWEIKVLNHDVEALEKINNAMRLKFENEQ